MSTLKEAAAARGIRLGVGPVDPSGGHDASMMKGESDQFFFDAAWPHALNAATDPGAALIINEFGGMLDLCTWAVGNTDASHFGQALRWTGPGQYNFTGCDETYAWALANGLKVCISDPAYSGPPPWIADGGYTPAQLTALLHDWYTAFYSRYPAAYLTTLANEILPATYTPGGGAAKPGDGFSLGWWCEHTSIGQPGGKTLLEFVDQVYRWVRDIHDAVRGANPPIKIVMNQNQCEGVSPEMVTNAANYKLWLQDMIAMGTPIDGAGIQSHFMSSFAPYNFAGYKSVLQSLAALGLEVFVTEFDINRDSSAYWAANHYGLVKAAVESRCVKDFTFWSIRDPLYYGLNGALYSATYQRTTGTTLGAATSARAAVEQAFLDAEAWLTIVAAPASNGIAAVSGTRFAGSTVAVEAPGATVGAVSYPDATSYACAVSGLPPGSTTITATSGSESASVVVQSGVQLLAPALDLRFSPVAPLGSMFQGYGQIPPSLGLSVLGGAPVLALVLPATAASLRASSGLPRLELASRSPGLDAALRALPAGFRLALKAKALELALIPSAPFHFAGAGIFRDAFGAAIAVRVFDGAQWKDVSPRALA